MNFAKFALLVAAAIVAMCSFANATNTLCKPWVDIEDCIECCNWKGFKGASVAKVAQLSDGSNMCACESS